MNQILNSNGSLNNDSSNISNNRNKKFNFLKFQFIFCTVLAFITTVYYFYMQYEKFQNQVLSEDIVENFSITNLYDNYDASYISNENIYKTDTSTFSVIGLIEIKSIGVYYPIINEFNYDLLKIAPCKFLGPNPNEVRKYVYCRTQL